MLALPSTLYSFLVWEHLLVLALCLLAVWAHLVYQERRRVAALVVAIASVVLACTLRMETAFVIAPITVWATWQHLRRQPSQQAGHRAWIGLVGVVLLTLMAIIYVLFAQDVPGRLPRLILNWTPQRVEQIQNSLLYLLVGYGATPATWILLLFTAVLGNAAIWVLRTRSAAAACTAAAILLATGIITLLSVLRVTPFGVVNPGIVGASPLLMLPLLATQPDADARLQPLRRGLWTVLAGYAAGAFLFPALAFRPASVMTQMNSTWASRYFLTLYPLTALLALAALHTWWAHAGRSTVRTVLGTAVALSLGVGILGNLTGLFRIWEDKIHIRQACQAIWTMGERIVVTDDWWRAEECAANAAQTYLLVHDQNELDDLTQTLWAAGVNTFTFASRNGIVPEQQLVQKLSACYRIESVTRHDAANSGASAQVALRRRSDRCP
jgi:hypothetical protein